VAAPGEGLPGWSERATEPKDPDFRAPQVVSDWTFRHCEDEAFAAYSAATSSRSSAQEAPDCSRIIPTPFTALAAIDRRVVVPVHLRRRRAPAAIASFTFAVFRALHTQMIMRTICINVRTIVNRVLPLGACKAVAPRKSERNQ